MEAAIELKTFEPRVRRRVSIETEFGPADFVSFHALGDEREHIALVFAPKSGVKTPLIRIHSECLTGDVFGSGRCDCGEQLKEALAKISADGGVLLYLRQEGRGIGLYNKIDAYALQDLGHDTFEANLRIGLPMDMRRYDVAANMLKALEVTQVRMLTNNPDKASQLVAEGIDVKEIIPTQVHLKAQNRSYLRAKAVKGGHSLDLALLEEAK